MAAAVTVLKTATTMSTSVDMIGLDSLLIVRTTLAIWFVTKLTNFNVKMGGLMSSHFFYVSQLSSFPHGHVVPKK